MALKDEPLADEWQFAWVRVAAKYESKLVSNLALCKTMTWKDNENQDWAKKSMKPAPWTRIPNTHTYGQMLRFDSMLPATDLQGRQISREYIQECLEKEQREWRKALVFMSKFRRNESDHPSAKSKGTLHLATTDRRSYAQLIRQASNMKEKNVIEDCRINDEKDRNSRFGQDESIQDAVVKAVFNTNSQPIACMGCLSPDLVPQAYTDMIIKTNLRRSFCEECMFKFALDYGLEFISKSLISSQ